MSVLELKLTDIFCKQVSVPVKWALICHHKGVHLKCFKDYSKTWVIFVVILVLTCLIDKDI